MVSTTQILAKRALRRLCGEDCVEWAVGMLERGYDSRTLRIPAGTTPPFNHFELASGSRCQRSIEGATRKLPRFIHKEEEIMRRNGVRRFLKTACLLIPFLLLGKGAPLCAQAVARVSPPTECLSLRIDHTQESVARLLETLKLEPIDQVKSRASGSSSVSSQTYRASSPEGPIIIKVTCEGACWGQGCLAPSCTPFNGKCPACTCNEGCSATCTCAQSAEIISACVE